MAEAGAKSVRAAELRSGSRAAGGGELVQVRIPAADDEGPTTVEAELLDLSAGGMQVSSPHPVEVGVRFQAHFVVGKSIECVVTVEVRHCAAVETEHDAESTEAKSRYRIGGVFYGLPKSKRIVISLWVDSQRVKMSAPEG